jgi:hypothetical protein
MNALVVRFLRAPHYWKVLTVLALATIVALPFSSNISHLLTLMINAYALVALAAMLNRSSTRNSWAYHGVVLLASSVASYWVFRSVHGFISAAGLTYVIALAYITATVWGNFTGSKFSIFLERMLGIKAVEKRELEKKEKDVLSKRERKVQYALLIILGVLTVALLVVTRSDYVTAVSVLGLKFLDNGIHTFVRRSRNVGNTLFHNIGLLAQGLNFFFLFRFLASEDMSWIFFLPFAVGGILGGLFVQKFTIIAERKIKADPDSHLNPEGVKSASRFSVDLSLFPRKTLIILVIAAIGLIWWADSPLLALVIVGLATAQYIAFTLISRARTRKNRTYEAYASVSSNGTWLATFGKLDKNDWAAPLFMPYIVGVMIGGNIGVGIAMHIERWFGISSD